MRRPRLLFISPVLPNPSLQGTSMRAFVFLQALAKHHRVHLLLHGINLVGHPQQVDPRVKRLCSSVTHMPLRPRHDILLFLYLRIRKRFSGRWLKYPLNRPWDWIPLTPRMKSILNHNAALKDFDVIHVFRMAMLPLAAHIAAASPRAKWQLDMDDIESKTRYRLSRLYQRRHLLRQAQLAAYDAALYEPIEGDVATRFAPIFVCSEKDKLFLLDRYPTASITVVPNVVPIPGEPMKRVPAKVFTMIFVGTLDYYPNVEGILWFASRVLPRLRKRARRPFRLYVVGNGSRAELHQPLMAHPEIELVGYVPHLSPWYAKTDAVIVPLRAGGGTRIKILEAFAHRCPVVSTTLGVEGIAARPGHNFLAGDDHRAFADQCIRLMSDAGLGEKLIHNSFKLVHEKYRTSVAQRIILDGCGPHA